MNRIKYTTILILIVLLVSGCSNSNNNQHYDSELKDNENSTIKEEKTTFDLNNITFPLYDIRENEYPYPLYVNDDIRINKSVIIDNKDKKIYDLISSTYIDYDKYAKDNPTHIVRNFVLLRDECKNEIGMDEGGKYVIDNFGYQNLQGIIDPTWTSENITPEYLMYDWCSLSIDDNLINTLVHDGYRVWGRALDEGINDPYSKYPAPPRGIAVEYNNDKDEVKLYEKYGLFAPFGYSPEKYYTTRLNLSSCKEYGLKCVKMDN